MRRAWKGIAILLLFFQPLLAEIPSTQIIEGIRPIYQRKNECVPATVTMLLRFWGYEVDRDEAREALEWTRERGVTSDALVLSYLSRFKDLKVEVDAGEKVTREVLMRHIAGGRPVIVKQWRTLKAKEGGGSSGELAHWRIVYGYDLESGRFFIQDPLWSFDRLKIDFDEFQKLWDISGRSGGQPNWMLLMYRADGEKKD
jgi:ABC-type bacteriocin/lantibiotic exporter with double-glycine peptidase domain